MFHNDQRGRIATYKEVSDKLIYIRKMLADRTRRKIVLAEIKKKWL